ncbi:MAG: type I 3-dehydroquinate dehydratase [Lachnospiraceae bacterium]|nr:type I 3-dehydroquinate dehydratase [Lachnospiraceae bacterium]
MNNADRILEFLTGDKIPKICAPIVESTREGILKMAGAVYNSEADIAEWRVDYYKDFHNIDETSRTLSGIKAVIKNKPLLFTFRTLHEGGEADISYNGYFKLLSTAGINADLVDVEIYRNENIKELTGLLRKHAAVIGSYHDFNGTPPAEEIAGRLVYMKNMGADIPKIAVMPKKRIDVINLMEASLAARERLGGAPVITMSMSGMGVISRIAAETTGSVLTFGCIGKPSAPGQIEVKRLKELIDLLHYNEETHISQER